MKLELYQLCSEEQQWEYGLMAVSQSGKIKMWNIPDANKGNKSLYYDVDALHHVGTCKKVSALHWKASIPILGFGHNNEDDEEETGGVFLMSQMRLFLREHSLVSSKNSVFPL